VPIRGGRKFKRVSKTHGEEVRRGQPILNGVGDIGGENNARDSKKSEALRGEVAHERIFSHVSQMEMGQMKPPETREHTHIPLRRAAPDRDVSYLWESLKEPHWVPRYTRGSTTLRVERGESILLSRPRS